VRISQAKAILVCLILLPAVGTVGPRGPVAELSDGSRKFADKRAYSALRSHAAALFRSARYIEAAEAYQRAYQEAMQEGEYKSAALSLNDVGAALFSRFAYQEAMRAFLDARQLAERFGDREGSGMASLNLASLYLQMGDLRAAAVETGRAAESLETVPGSAYRGEALALMGRLKAREGDLAAAEAMFWAAARVADAQGDIALKARVVNQLGLEYLNEGRLNEADRAMTEAFRLRLLGHNRDIGQSYCPLGMLRTAQRDFGSAEVLLDRALAAQALHPGRVPSWLDYHARGQLRVAQGRLPDAVRDFRHALVLANQWRLEVLPTDSVRLSTGVGLAQLYSSFIRAAGELYDRTKRRALARETFEAAEELRAATLRTAGRGGADWRSRLPDEYRQTLDQLRAARVRMQREPSGACLNEARGLRQRLSEMEAQAGAPEGPDDLGDLLAGVVRALAPSEALVSFHLDEPCSYSWTVTRRSFKLRRLAGAGQLRPLIRDFSAAARSGTPESTALGAHLYRELFGQNAGGAESQPHWLLAADSALLDLPFSSLVVGQVHGRPVFLIERHSVTVLPAARLLLAGIGSRNSRGGFGPFLGVGDPIYNAADPRQSGRGGSAAPDQLPRLTASDREIRECARAWRPDSAPVLLEGPAATRQMLAAALVREPGVIHLAAHMVRSADDPPRQLIQLSLLPGGDPDYLGAEEIGVWRLRKPAIVVLSGCASGRTEAQAPVFSTFAGPSDPQALQDSGLVGLARAWLAAGAGAVVASHWSTPDDTGELFRSFYSHLSAKEGAGVATALQRAQIDMLETKTWRSAPGHWAAYFAIGRN
jgi:CHAT domain-containing protein/tetratricopeptide (TPR) repeat protein